MTDSTKIDAAIAQLYDAAVGTVPWGDASAAIARLVSADMFAFMLTDRAENNVSVVATAGIDRAAVEAYEQYYWSCDLWAIAGRESCPPMTALAMSRFVSEQEWRQSEIFADFCQRLWPALHGVGAVFPVGRHLLAQIGIHRPLGSAEFEVADEKVLQHILPHLQRALLISRKLTEAERAHAESVAALDLLSTGMIVVDAACRVVQANAAGEAILDQGSGLMRLVGGRVGARRHEETQRLHGIVASVKAQDGTGAGRGGAIAVTRSPPEPPLAVLVAPLSHRRVHMFESRGIAVLLITDPASSPVLPAGMLQALYGLTKSEAQLVIGLSEGARIESVAVAFGISTNTAKTHLKQVFRKLGISRQSELVGLVARLPAAPATGTRW